MLLLVNQEALRFALLAAEWGHSFRPAYFRLGAALAGSAVCAEGTRERICGLFTAGGPLSSVRSAIVYVAFKEDANQLVGEGYLSSLAL